MQIPLSEDQILIKESARRFGQEFGGAERLRRLRDAAAAIDAEGLAAAGEQGWLGLIAPQNKGGAGLGAMELCLLAEELGRALATLPIASAAAGILALAEGRTQTNDALLEKALAGAALIIPAFQGDALDGDGARIAMEVGDDGSILLDGSLTAVPAASAAAGFIVDAGHGDERALLYVDGQAEGLAIVQKRAIDGTQLGTIELARVGLPARAVLARGGAAAALRERLDTVLQLALAAGLLGVMQSAHSLTLEYLATREQFGRPIGKFQALQHGAVDNYMHIESNRALLYETARLADRGEESAHWLALATKARVGESALMVTKSAVQMHGAIGFTDEHAIGVHLKRALTLSSTHGPIAALRRRYREVSFASGKEPGGHIPSFRVDSEEDARFRRQVRAWLEETLPRHLRDLPTRPSVKDAMWWHRQLYERGWAAPEWPKKWGGMAATLGQQVIFADEMGRIGAPEISAQALHHIGPILIRFGTEEQKARHLGGMISGEKIWCQGYSEPNAGSDLASLRTAAVVDGDHLVINGQKIWTTWAHYADWMFALVRTDPNAPKKQEGITFVLIDMKTPGITPRPIQTIADEDEFAEVFLDDVRVPLENVVGELNKGWTVATALLANERTGSSNPMRNVMALREIKQAAAASGALDDVAFQDKLIGAELDILALSAAFAQVVALTEAGEQLGAQSSFVKLLGTESLQQLADILIHACGSDGALKAGADGDVDFEAARFFMRARRATIAAGTSEIQRNIIAKRVLNL